MYLDQTWWEETLILYIGYLSLNMRKRSNDIVMNIIEEPIRDEKKRNVDGY